MMCSICGDIIKAIDHYIAMADDDLKDELEDEGRALPDDSGKTACRVGVKSAGLAGRMGRYAPCHFKKLYECRRCPYEPVHDECRSAEQIGRAHV